MMSAIMIQKPAQHPVASVGTQPTICYETSCFLPSRCMTQALAACIPLLPPCCVTFLAGQLRHSWAKHKRLLQCYAMQAVGWSNTNKRCCRDCIYHSLAHVCASFHPGTVVVCCHLDPAHPLQVKCDCSSLNRLTCISQQDHIWKFAGMVM